MSPQISRVEKTSRVEKALVRRDAIVTAATGEFVANGFAATRIEDIAARASVAKGTVYLNFADKQALFEEAVRARMLPIVAQLTDALEHEGPSVRATVESVLQTALRLLSDPQASEMVRLVLSESIRFPALTGFYRREVVAPMAMRCGQLLAKAAQAGELTAPQTARYPHLVIAPLIIAIVFNGALSEIGIDDVQAMLKVHLDNVFSGRP